MKKKWFKRAVGMGLVLALTAGLFGGCGKKNENAGLAKENVYKFQSIELPDFGGDDYGIRGSAYLNGIVYMVVQVYHWESNNGFTDIKLLSINKDASDVRLASLEMPPKEIIEGVNPSEEGTEPNTGEGGGPSVRPMPREIMAVEPSKAPGSEEAETDGDAESGDDAESEEDDTESGEIDDDFDIDDGKGDYSNIWENTSFNKFCVASDGNIYAIKNYNYEDYTNPENGISVSKSYICCWGMDGSLRWQQEIGGFDSEEEWVYLNNMVTAADGTLYLILSGDNAYKIKVDAEGNLSDRIPINEEAGEVLQNGSIYTKEDGSIMVMYWDTDTWSKQYLVSYDVETDALGEPTLLPNSLSYGGYNTMSVGNLSDLVYSNSSGIFTYKIGDEDGVKKMDFVNSDMMNPSFNVVVELDDKSFIGVFYENYDGNPKAGVFTYVNPEDVPDKSVLVLAGNYVGDDLKKRIVEYNRTNDEYRIVIKEYNSYNTFDDYQAGYTQLNNDIITGKMPDILITEGLPMENYATKGLLADVGKMIEEDEELSQVEFVQNVFDAYSMDGKLYYVIPYFNVGTMLAKTSLIGERTTWTMDEALQFMETMPEDAKLMGDLTRSDFFSSVMEYCGSDFINVETGECNFNSDNFLKMMEFAKSLPEEYSEDYWMNSSSSYQTQYRDNKTLLCRQSISSLKNLSYTINGRFGEDVTYVGFPTDSGQGSFVYSYSAYAISSRSSYTDAAWDFIKYYLSDEYQSGLEWNLPIQKKYFMEFAQTATQRPFWVDEEGNKVEYDDSYYMNGEEIILPPLTQEQLDKAIAFIFSVNKCSYNNNDIRNIINEEMEAYFSGQKTAQEVVQIIQSRAQVYVDANR